LIITNAKNRYGVIYPYFVCLGRHQKRTACTRKAMLVTKIEELVEDYWATVRLTPALRDAIEEGLRTELAIHRKQAEAEHRHLVTEKTKLTNQRQKLLEAIYRQAVPLDLIAGEQQRIADQLTTIEARLTAATTEFHRIEANLTRALDLARDCHGAYLMAGPYIRRLFNQAFFTHLYIDEDDVHGEYAPPFDTLLADPVREAGQAIQDDPEQGHSMMQTVLSRIVTLTNTKIPGALRAAGDLILSASSPVQGVEGSNISTLVPRAGLEPAAIRLEGGCSIQLSYRGRRRTKG
jgi:site-specific DNA recombinase